MVAILDPDHSVDLDEMARKLLISLPSYARPLFVRVLDSLPMTGMPLSFCRLRVTYS